MLNLIDQSFFIRGINIPNLPATGTSPILADFLTYIVMYEKECLKKILGSVLYKLFISHPTDQRMIDLKNGVEYTDLCGQVRDWQGLIHDTNQSLIANYIYFYYQESKAALTTGVATKVSKSEAGTSISPAEKMCNAWNWFSDEVFDMTDFLWQQKSNGVRVYPEYTIKDFSNARDTARTINVFSI